MKATLIVSSSHSLMSMSTLIQFESVAEFLTHEFEGRYCLIALHEGDISGLYPLVKKYSEDYSDMVIHMDKPFDKAVCSHKSDEWCPCIEAEYQKLIFEGKSDSIPGSVFRDSSSAFVMES